MKKAFSYSLLITGCFLFSCNNSQEKKELAQVTTASLPTASAPPEEYFPVAAANSYILNYNNDTTILQQHSFVLNSQQLLDYINTTGATILNFIVGENEAGDSLFLFVTPVASNGQHIFYERNDTCFVLKETHVVNMPTVLEPQISTIDTYFVEAMDTGHAQRIIQHYEKGGFRKNNGWMYSANDLAGYIQAGINAGGMRYLQCILALKNSTIDMVMAGSDDGVNHMYFNYNDKNCVMENIDPCPCEIANGGALFGASQCAY